MKNSIIVVLAAAAALAACKDAPGPTTTSSSEAKKEGPFTDWEGTWNGPEGTWLSLSTDVPGVYTIVIKNLDGENKYRGTAEGSRIVFERNNKRETLQLTDGKGTGMKWLEGKQRCLALKEGEGWCKD
jgi:hypothetical protein